MELAFAGRGIEWRFGGGRSGGTAFTASLVPGNGGHLLPLRAAVRTPQGPSADHEVTAQIPHRPGAEVSAA
ncbi:DUF1905 domain-containing protein [Streptomyces sp. NPDC048521]|uniref:DUF1905 domain-containing protein n=1 Tax=Streptomyces sp. NPDC048521 TaxID=3365566 RepID=UPI003712CC09